MTSEDGTIKHYFIHAKRLSAKDAFLNDLQFSVGNLNPAFDPDVLSYSCKFVMTNGDIVLYLYCLLRSTEFYFLNMTLVLTLTHYFILEGLLPCNVAQVVLKPVAPDTKNVVLVCGEKPGTPTALNVGETNVSVEVTSADGSNKKA